MMMMMRVAKTNAVYHHDRASVDYPIVDFVVIIGAAYPVTRHFIEDRFIDYCFL